MISIRIQQIGQKTGSSLMAFTEKHHQLILKKKKDDFHTAFDISSIGRTGYSSFLLRNLINMRRNTLTR